MRLRPPYRRSVWLREGSSDLGTFHEIFVGDLYRSVLRKARDCRYVIDLGANIGLATRFLAGQFPDAKLLAVEPDSRNFEMLQRNVQPLTETGRCTTLRAAVWKANQTLHLTDVPQSGAFDSIQVSDNGQQLSRVEGLRMDRILETSGFPQIDVLKIDVEGAETQAFMGNTDWLKKTRVIAIEFHGNSRQESRFDALMREYNFEIDDSHKFTVIAFRRD